MSSESCFEKDVQEAMIAMAMELKQRARHVDKTVRILRDLRKEILHMHIVETRIWPYLCEDIIMKIYRERKNIGLLNAF